MNEVEVYCPNCGEIFNSEKKMLEHYNLKHEEILQEENAQTNGSESKHSGEYVLGYIGNAYQGMGMSTLTLFFTTKNVIVARVVSSGTNITAFVAGGVIIGGSIAGGYGQEKAKQLKKISPKEILSNNSKNFAIPYSEVTRIQIKQPGTFSRGSIQIETLKSQMKFGMSNKGIANLYKYDFSFLPELTKILGNKLAIKN